MIVKEGNAMNITNKKYEARSKEEQQFLDNYNPGEYAPIAVTVDAVVFGVIKNASDNYRKLDSQSLKILLIKRDEYPYKNWYTLPGGFVSPEETLEDTLERTLESKTGLKEIYSEQLYTFGGINRDPRMRIISCAYISLIDAGKARINGAEWFDIEEAKKITLAFDHNLIIEEAIKRIRGKINYTDIVFNMMPTEFTISQLQEVYEIILGEKLLAPAFRRTIADKIVDTGKMTSNAGHRPSRIFIRK